ncbi:hypothetical protein [Agrobacterium larrymoorei]|uniref:Uncharacterized protein n=1 Tax=Agrobacterium larrymoorei TaxID=160699 RepID=A0AAF0HBW9_9HYPH|nr:hypothetical protein [Agrobacterium larrymoorei]WHA41630.1 hypothetical protein CFBP5477_003075 [Agrobacterium larrymoorei]
MARKPVISLAPFVEAHEDLDKAIWRYHVSAAGKNKLPPDLLTKFLKQNASDDFAINLHTRIAYAKSADHFIRRRLRLNELGSVFFVDIVCKKHVTSLSDAEPFNLGKLKKWMAKRLKGMNYFGALDAAYYYNGANITGKEGPAIFWHGHFMVWGVSEEEIEVRQTMVNERFEAGFPQAKCLY